MHPSAYQNASRFYEKYCFLNIENKTILDIGSYDVNGSLRPIFNRAKKYIGLDQAEGPNVDVVGSSHEMVFEDNMFDVVVSSSCFEHDDMFWLTFIEMCRVCKPGGYIYACAPSAGFYHGFPGDNWRFYIDSWSALEKWSTRCKYNVSLLESYIDHSEIWKDSIGIYIKK